MRKVKAIRRKVKSRLHFWCYWWRGGGIGWLVWQERIKQWTRWESVQRHYRSFRSGWTSPNYRRERLFQMTHGMPRDFFFNEGPVCNEPMYDYWYDPGAYEPDDYEEWWEDYMPGRLIYYYVLLCRRFRFSIGNTEMWQRRERTECRTEERDACENIGRKIVDIMSEERKLTK